MMEVAAPIFLNAFSSIGASALGTAAAGASTAATAATGAAVVGTLATGVSTFFANRYQSAMLAQQAQIERRNAENAAAAGAREAQDADIEAAAAIASDRSRMATTGFKLNSPSYLRRTARNRLTAGINRQRIVEDAERQRESAANRAAGIETERRGLRSANFFNIISTGLNLGNDVIGGANLIASNRARRLNTTAAGVR